MNNKGFAISSILYSIFLLFIMLLILIMSNLTNSRLSIDKLKEEVKNSLDEIAYDKGDSGYARIVFASEDTTIKVDESFDLMAGVSVLRYDGVTLEQAIAYESSPEFDSTKVGNYVITYGVTIDGKNYTRNRLISVVDSNATIFSYTGNYQTFTAPKDGYYKIELWGGGSERSTSLGMFKNSGGYTSGYIFMSKNEKYYIYVGGKDGKSTFPVGGTSPGGWNGGGVGISDGTNYPGNPGSGATDIRLVQGAWDNLDSLKSRIMVAGGGGGEHNVSNTTGDILLTSYAGGLLGSNGGVPIGAGYCTSGCTGGIAGTQQSGYAFGKGQNSIVYTGGNGNGAGGGGYYGGYSGDNPSHAWLAVGGGGGSSFISGYAGVNAITSNVTLTHSNNTVHYSNKYFIDGQMTPGINVGNGKAVVTYTGKPERQTTLLNNVRYVKDCINGSSANVSNHWVELQAIYEGINVAKGKTVTGTVVVDGERLPYSAITDGDITSANYAKASATGLQCVTVDLGQSYNLDEVAVWHYYADSRTYNDNTTYVSSDNTNWQSVINKGGMETSLGKRFSSYDNSNTITFAYTGNYQTFTAPKNGYYQIELWGAQGGNKDSFIGGMGGYTKGKIYLNKDEQLYVYIGGNPILSSAYNGGGNGGAYGNKGGGATDIRLVSGVWNDANSLKSRIMIAGGGGGAGSRGEGYGDGNGGNAGGLIGSRGQIVNSTTPYGSFAGEGGTQIAGGQIYAYNNVSGNTPGPTQFGSFGMGGGEGYVGGGGGYYGGGGMSHAGGGGGSSFISGYAGVNAITSAATLTHSNNTRHYSNKYFIDGEVAPGVNTGNGKTIINYIGDYQKQSPSLDNVRYIRDCINGSSANLGNHWVELQAIKDGVNVAYGKTVTGTGPQFDVRPYTRITDGDISTANYAETTLNGLQCITVDLGQTYNLDEIAVWHYYGDVRTYNNNTTSVSSNNTTWQSVIDKSETETSVGKRINAYSNNYSSTYAYTGNYQTFTAPKDGYYKIELWGAQGGDYDAILGGKGGYSSGYTYLTKSTNLYLYIGGAPGTSETGGYNGGGSLSAGQSYYGRSGGGATDIRLVNGTWNDASSLKSRIMIAGGGGGANNRNIAGGGCGYGQGAGGAGGTLFGGNGISTDHTLSGCTYGWGIGTGGAQTSGGQQVTYNSSGVETARVTTGQFGYASIDGQSNGGGGYYGGGNAGHGGAGGGSSFISGYAGVNAITSAGTLTHSNNTIHYSNMYFINNKMTSGTNSSNGKAIITYVSKPERKNALLDNVRYVKDCINGSSVNLSNHWVELQAIKDGVNVAKGKTVIGTSAVDGTYLPYSVITDGDIASANYSKASTTGLQCVTVDLGQSYNLDEVALWHYWADGRTYNSNATSVSSDNTNWQSIINITTPETSNGKRFSAYSE